MLEKNREYRFYEIIEYIREMYKKFGEVEVYKDNNWCVYSNKEDIDLNSYCYIAEYPQIDDDTDEEIFPEYVSNNNLELVYCDELLQDVIIVALKKDKDVSSKKLLQFIKYYDENDCLPPNLN
ncbi:MAG: hypothetical protein V8R02_04615 [Clostridium sp.]